MGQRPWRCHPLPCPAAMKIPGWPPSGQKASRLHPRALSRAPGLSLTVGRRCPVEELQTNDDNGSGRHKAGQAAAGGGRPPGQPQEGGILCDAVRGLQVSLLMGILSRGTKGGDRRCRGSSCAVSIWKSKSLLFLSNS